MMMTYKQYCRIYAQVRKAAIKKGKIHLVDDLPKFQDCGREAIRKLRNVAARLG
jgi:hypothetical protein